MSTIQITSQVSTEDLLHGVESLPTEELEQFVTQLLDLYAKRKDSNLSEPYQQGKPEITS